MSRFYQPFFKARRAIVQVFQDRNIGHGGETARLVVSGAAEMVVDSLPSVAPPRSASAPLAPDRLHLTTVRGWFLSFIPAPDNQCPDLHPTDIRLGAQPGALGLVTSVYFRPWQSFRCQSAWGSIAMVRGESRARSCLSPPLGQRCSPWRTVF